MQNISPLCSQFAQILCGKPRVEAGVCSVQRDRPHIEVTILGRPCRSVLSSEWSFESLDREGRALTLGETALLEEEVPAFTWHLQRSGIVVSAIHNHWLKESPRLIYVHYESVEDPLSFARKAAEAFSILR